MLFSSLVFLFYFLPISLIVYYSLWFSNPLKNAALLILSLVFYAWGEPKYIIILFISVIVNYLLGIYIDKYRSNEKVAKFIIIIACIVNLATLFIFKYLGFVIRNINELHTYKIESTILHYL
jgi:alginate O-acetyltransferase complex protein AlgI